MNKDMPNGWTETTIGLISKRITKGSTPTSYGYSYKDSGIKFVKTENIDEIGKINNIAAFIDDETNAFLARSILEKNDILFSIAGTIGRVGIVKTNDLPANTNQALAIIRSFWNLINVKYIFYLLRSNWAQSQASGSIVGVGRANVSLTNIKDFKIPLPPSNEQTRIVSKIEELTTKLDAGIKSLKQVQIQLKKYRQSVLKSAVEGKLTSEWRKQHNDELEPGDKLLERILKERKEKWEVEQLANYKAKGIKPSKDWKDKYKEPSPPDTSKLPELPEGWVYLTIEMFSDWINGKGLTKKKMVTGDYLVYGGNGIVGSHEEYLSSKKCIVVGRVGAHCGNIHIAQEKSWITDNAIYSKWCSSQLFLKYAEILLFTKNLNQIAGGSGQPYVSQGLLNPLVVGIPSRKEQEVIVKEVERVVSIIEETQNSVESELKRSQSLRQSILKQAFEGKLVPQDPNDEPASVLLERIKAEK